MKKGGVIQIPKKKQTAFDQNAYIQKFIKEKYVRLQILLNKETDSDIIEQLDSQTNKSEYVKNLIRADIRQH